LKRIRVGFVGARDFKNIPLIKKYINKLSDNAVVVSGGAIGVDQASVRYAKKRGLEFKEHLPALRNDMEYYERVQAYYARNKLIVLDSDYIIAFTDRTREGGTWNTIEWAIKHKVPVLLVRSTGERVNVK